MRWVWFACLVGCSSGGANNGPPIGLDLAQPPAAGWTLTGTLSGFSLQDQAVSGEAHDVGGGVLVQLSSRAKVCDLLQANSCPNGRLLGFRIGKSGTGSFTVVAQDPPGAAQARIFFLDLDAQCGENTMVGATSGTLTVSGSDLVAGGFYTFSFDASTPGGPISGDVRAPFCQI